MNAAELIEAVRSRFERAVAADHAFRGDATLTLRPESLLEVARFLKEDPALRMDLLVDVTAVDWSTFGKRPPPAFFASSGVAIRPAPLIPGGEAWPGPPAGARFTVVYHFFSTLGKHRLRLVVPLGGAADAAPEIDSLTPLWRAADWLEREAWDMFGIRFRGHPDLRRLLMYDGFEGHPLRKDYPVNKRQPLIGPVN